MTALDALVNEIRIITKRRDYIFDMIVEKSSDTDDLQKEVAGLIRRRARLYDILYAYVDYDTDIVLNKLSGPTSCYVTNLPFSTSLVGVI